MIRWCRYYGWAYLMLRELGWQEMGMTVWKDTDGTPWIMVKMYKPETT